MFSLEITPAGEFSGSIVPNGAYGFEGTKTMVVVKDNRIIMALQGAETSGLIKMGLYVTGGTNAVLHHNDKAAPWEELAEYVALPSGEFLSLLSGEIFPAIIEQGGALQFGPDDLFSIKREEGLWLEAENPVELETGTMFRGWFPEDTDNLFCVASSEEATDCYIMLYNGYWEQANNKEELKKLLNKRRALKKSCPTPASKTIKKPAPKKRKV